ncbi:Cyclin-dependent kinase D-2 [Araneus ventricosus]|uniref:Cyclin-dependent kinase D-2 n=1 Tax=Araneus ventricosus TaxID=182803 RepID=A0A4Y2DUI7_ARAVE|nr:Cyclin-dependent kinase D-2 [Araneus ventricosus]
MPDALQSAMDYLKQKEGFDCKDVLGKGTYGSVVKVSSKDRGSMAAKIVENRVVNLLEIKEWSNLNHPNVLRLLDMIFNVDGVVIFMTELMQTNLFMRLQDKEFKKDAKAPEKCRQYARQVLCGLAYIHHLDLCHLDLRAENVFIARDGRAVVADFSGLCRKGEMKKFCPLPHSLRPPEMFTSKKKVAPMPIDLWAYGLLLANMFLGKGFYICTVKNQKAGHIDAVLQYTGLFRCQNYVENFFTQTYPNSTLSEGRIEEMMSLMNMFLQIDPELRIATEDALKHSFLSFTPEKTGAVILEPDTSGTSKSISSLSVDTAAEDTESPNLDVKFLQHSTGDIKPKMSRWQKYKFRFGKLRLSLLSPPVSIKPEKSKTEEPPKMNKSSTKLFFIK